jgi:Protein of unknown function (DUF3443)
MKPRTVMMLAIVVTLLATLTMLAFADPSFAAANNVMNANVNHGVSGQGVEQAFGQIKVCAPGSTTQCQNIAGLLIDTGSFGLRIFAQALTVHLPVQTAGSDRIAECAFFGSLTTWGRVATADVTMGGEPTIQNLPVQIINPNFPAVGHRPASCNGGVPLAQSPQQENFNGILGVGMVQYDGGSTNYYTCTPTTCTPTTQPLDLQVQNPVALLPVDNNGVLLNLPLPPTNGAATLTGQLIFGVNTETNNQIPGTFKVYTADANLQFTTVFQGQAVTGFIDSGSNGYFYDNPNLPLCPFDPPWYCPQGLTGQRASNTGSDGINTGTSQFAIANAEDLFLTGSAAFYDLGANLGPGMFDWGLPFFLGRKVFVGIDGTTIPGVSESPPFWAYKTN